MFGLRGVLMEFNRPRPSLSNIDSIYLLEEIKVESRDIDSSIPMILVGTPRSVISHSLSMSDFVLSLSEIVVVNVSMSSTHTVMIAKSSLVCQMYMQGSDCKCV